MFAHKKMKFESEAFAIRGCRFVVASLMFDSTFFQLKTFDRSSSTRSTIQRFSGCSCFTFFGPRCFSASMSSVVYICLFI